jgi:uncharacterized cupin superfamily protein
LADGEITVDVDGERMVLPAAGSAFAPRGTVHAFQNFSNTQAQILVMVTPGGFHHFYLPGHGASDAPLRKYTATHFADDLAWLAIRARPLF